MNIVKVDNEIYLETMVQFQKAMARESEGLELQVGTLRAGISKVIKNKHLGHYFIALDGETPIGMLLTIPEWSDWRCQTVLWIHSVYIQSDHRRKGVYKAMYSHIKGIVDSDQSFAGIRLYVDKSNKNAIKVYEQLGMSCEHYELYEYLKNG